MPNRLKPYLVIIFIIWPLATIGMKLANEDQTEISRAEIVNSIRVSGQVEKVEENITKRSHTFWAYASIPPTMGYTKCDGPISESTYQAIFEEKLKAIDFYVGKFGCWTAEDKDRRASQTEFDHWFMGAMLSLIPAFLIYMLIAIIPFGKTHKSLNKRWRSKATYNS
jgi:hypothetical protein